MSADSPPSSSLARIDDSSPSSAKKSRKCQKVVGSRPKVSTGKSSRGKKTAVLRNSVEQGNDCESDEKREELPHRTLSGEYAGPLIIGSINSIAQVSPVSEAVEGEIAPESKLQSEEASARLLETCQQSRATKVPTWSSIKTTRMASMGASIFGKKREEKHQMKREGKCLVEHVQDRNRSVEVDLQSPLSEVRAVIAKHLHVKVDEQRLIYYGKEFGSDNSCNTLGDFGVPPNGKVYLVIELDQNSNSGKRTLKAGTVSVHVCVEDGQHYDIELPLNCQARHLKKKLSELAGIPVPCISLRVGHDVCFDDAMIHDELVFMATDLQLEDIGPFKMTTASFKEHSFTWPESFKDNARRQVGLPETKKILRKGGTMAKLMNKFTSAPKTTTSFETTMVCIHKEALQGDALKLSAAVPRQPLVLSLSPLAKITIDVQIRTLLAITSEAQFVGWLYPAAVDWHHISSESLSSTSPDVALLTGGGFAFFDLHFNLLSVSSLLESTSGALRFGDPVHVPPRVSAELWKQGRVSVVTHTSWFKLGIESFAWILPGEVLDGKVWGAHGGFMLLYHSSWDASDIEASGDRFFPLIQSGDTDLDFLRYTEDSWAHLESLSKTKSQISKSLRTSPGCSTLVECMRGKSTDWAAVERAAKSIRDPQYKLEDFYSDCVAAFPELALYQVAPQDDVQDSKTGCTSSGRTADEEYQRTLGALFAVYFLMRIDLDGKESFCFGVDPDDSTPNPRPDVNLTSATQANAQPNWNKGRRDSRGTRKRRSCDLTFATMTPEQRRANFYDNMCWDKFTDLFVESGILRRNERSELGHDLGRTKAMLVLTAIHDIMKNEALLPVIASEHAPYRGYPAGEVVRDHDVALAYVLEHFGESMPSYHGLGQDLQRVVLFTQGSMNFNNGWLVQGEAPPGPLFSSFRELITNGQASPHDVAFYFVHWLTDLAGAVPRPYDGMVKFVEQFPDSVLRAFLDSFPFVWDLAKHSASEVNLRYLEWQWTSLGLPVKLCSLEDEAVALARLCLAVQTSEKAAKVFEDWKALNNADRQVIAFEMGLTGVKREKYPWGAAPSDQGPCFIGYYGPATMTKHLWNPEMSVLRIMAELYRAARTLYPLSAESCGDVVMLQLAKLKDVDSVGIAGAGSLGLVWVLRQNGAKEAIVEQRPIVELTKALDASVVVLPLWRSHTQ